jgi:iron complex transport system substrate-binding protein
VRKLVATTFLIAALGANAAAGEAPRRVVSANLCADQLLAELADRDQVASLSPLSRDPQLSFIAAKAADYAVNRGVGEDIVRLDADLVLTGPFDNRYTRTLLAAKGVRFASIDPWTDFPDGYAQIRAVAALLGRPERGETLVARIEAALATLDEITAPARGATAVTLERRGFVYRGGLVGEVARRAGFRDAAPDLGVASSGLASLEALVAAKPQFLIVSDAGFAAIDEGQAFLAHPALRALWPAEKRIALPDRLTICGGPSTPAMIAQFRAEVAAKAR